MGVSGGRTTKFLAVIGAVVVASNPDGQSVVGGGYPALSHIESTFAIFLPQIHIMGNTYTFTQCTMIHLHPPFSDVQV